MASCCWLCPHSHYHSRKIYTAHSESGVVEREREGKRKRERMNMKKMGESTHVASLQRQTSIETEPMTLTIDQLQFAREAALYVMKTRSMEEALNIFTEGLEPVSSVLERDGDEMMNVGEELFDGEENLLPTFNSREIVSAPF